MANTIWRHAKYSALGVLHENPAAAARFIRDALGGQDVDVEFNRQFHDDGSQREHVLSGGMVYEFVKPTPALPKTEEEFAKHGSYARSMCYVVDDVDVAADILLAEGCKVIHREPGYAWIDASEQCALNFELRKAGEWPCHTGVRIATDPGPYMHNEIVTADPHACADFMIRVLGGELIEKAIADKIAGPDDPSSDMWKSDTTHVLHGGMVYQFIAPCRALVGWDTHMEKHGPCLHNTCYHVHDYHGVMKTLRDYGCKVQPRVPEDPDGGFDYNALYEGEGDDLIYTGWLDATEQCGLFIEILRRNHQWPSHVGYFFW